MIDKVVVHPKNRIVFVAVCGGIVFVVAGLVFWLFITNRLVWNPSDGVVSDKLNSASACGAGIVDQYNAAMNYVIRDGSDLPSVDEKGVKQVVADIKATRGYQEDATCQTMLYLAAVQRSDYEGASAAAAVVKKLNGQGIFPNNNILGIEPVLTFDRTLNTISPATQAAGSDGK